MYEMSSAKDTKCKLVQNSKTNGEDISMVWSIVGLKRTWTLYAEEEPLKVGYNIENNCWIDSTITAMNWTSIQRGRSTIHHSSNKS